MFINPSYHITLAQRSEIIRSHSGMVKVVKFSVTLEKIRYKKEQQLKGDFQDTGSKIKCRMNLSAPLQIIVIHIV